MISIAKSTNLEEVFSSKSGLSVVYFWAEWAPQCEQMKHVIEELTKDQLYKNITFISVEAEAFPKVSSQFGVNAVPTCVIVQNGKPVDRVNGVHIPELVTKMKEVISQKAISSADDDSDQIKNERLTILVKQQLVMLFMKGSPDQPKCGFSRQLVEILRQKKVDFGYFDILQDNSVREGLKILFNWPTFPQLYVAGELQGGLDVVRELAEGDELTEIIQSAMNKHLGDLLKRERVMLFMKGSPSTPRCGFSRQIVEILQKTGVPFGHFDILTDETVRQGLKTFSNWPTYPQLYVNGELIGGLDVVREMDSEGELVDVLK